MLAGGFQRLTTQPLLVGRCAPSSGFATLAMLASLTHIAPARESSGTRIRSYGRAQRPQLAGTLGARPEARNETKSARASGRRAQEIDLEILGAHSRMGKMAFHLSANMVL